MTDLTTEEKEVEVYENPLPPIVSSTVTTETPLDDLNLNWRENDIPERERTKHIHRLHPYLGKFIPQLAEVFLRKYFSPGQTVYDPFAGSGTALVQANELGINAVGSDISAFNALLCRCKTRRYNLEVVNHEVMDILSKAQSMTQNDINDLPLFGGLSHKPKTLTITDNEYLTQWFAPTALHELLTYKNLIDDGNYKYKDLLRIILSRSARSARLTTHFDLDFPKKPQTEPYYCYKHSRTCTPTSTAFKFLKRYSMDTLRRISEFAGLQTNATVDIYHDDSRYIDLPPIDGVVTSPPYVGLIDYHEQHAYAYNLLGLEDRRDKEIGAAAGGSSKHAQAEYKKSITDVLHRALEIMPIRGHLIVIAADKHNLYGEIAKQLGVRQIDTIQRHVNRRTGRRSGKFYESVFIWQKADVKS